MDKWAEIPLFPIILREISQRLVSICYILNSNRINEGQIKRSAFCFAYKKCPNAYFVNKVSRKFFFLVKNAFFYDKKYKIAIDELGNL